MKNIKLISRKITQLHFLLLLVCAIPVMGSPNIPYDSLGNVWIVAIDKSGSMKDPYRIYGNTFDTDSFRKEIEKTLSVLKKNWRIADSIDFNKDQFFIYHTGLSDLQVLKEGETITNLFIHPVEGKQGVYYRDFYHLYRVLYSQLYDEPYRYKQSLVSQIRILTLDKALSVLQNSYYKHIYILAITDEGEANDQWQTDYRTMKKYGGKQRLNEINTINRRLVYNQFATGEQGRGILTDMKENTDCHIHLYLYKYVTMDQISTDIGVNSPTDLIKFDIISQDTIVPKIANRDVENGRIMFIHTDEVRVNGIKRNTLMHRKVNQVQANIRLDIQYNDPILGQHMKQVPVVVQRFVPTDGQIKFGKVSLNIIIVILVLIILFYMVIRPRRDLMRIYTGNNRLICVKVGYFWQWERQNALTTIYPSLKSEIRLGINQHPCIHIINDNTQFTENFCVLISRRPMSFINKNMKELSLETLSKDGNMHNIPHVIQKYYFNSRQYKQVNRKLQVRSLGIHRKNILCWWRDKVLNRLYKAHYYWFPYEAIENDKNGIQIAIQSDYWKYKVYYIHISHQPISKDRDSRIVGGYYRNRGKKVPATMLLAYNQDKADENQIVIDGYRLSQTNDYGIPTLENVEHFYHFDSSLATPFEMDKNGHSPTAQDICLRIAKYASYVNWHEKVAIIGYTEHGLKQLKIEEHYTVTQVPFKEFLTLIDAAVENKKAKTQMIYTPFLPKEGNITVRHSSIGTHLYASPLPLPKRIIKQPCYRKLSNQTIWINDGAVRYLECRGGKVLRLGEYNLQD